MTTAALSAWLLSIMMAAVPPGGSRRGPAQETKAQETKAQGKARYTAIAHAMAKVSLDPKEKPLFAGSDGRAKTALLMLAISLHESHWRRDVDLGVGKQAKRRYHCLMQIAVPKGKTPEGWTARDLVRSRQRCFRRGLHILQRGRKHCRERGPRAFLNHYASGYCDHGRKAVAKRWHTFDTLWRTHRAKARRLQHSRR